MAPVEEEQALEGVRAAVAGLPGVSEVVRAIGRPCFQVAGKTFAYLMLEDGRPVLWVKSTFEAQQEAVDAEPERFFVPPYAGPQGWVGLRLGVDPDADEVAALLAEGWALQAPRRLLGQR